MKKLLHVVATPRAEESRTLKVTEAFLEEFTKTHVGCQVDTFNVCTEPLPELTVRLLDGKYVLLGGKDLTGALRDSWKPIRAHIQRFREADGYLLSTPMWNFSIPYYLKHYIDVIVQPKYLFQYTESGPEGLVKGKKMVVITSRGGDYGLESAFNLYDLQEPYLKTVFGFVGITDITFVNAQPIGAMGPEVQKEKIETARTAARKAAVLL